MSGPERYDPYVKKRNSEPTNCSLINTVQADDDPYEEAKAHIKENPASNCCTVEGRKVKQWQLPPNASVQLMKKDGSTFYYDSTKLPLD